MTTTCLNITIEQGADFTYAFPVTESVNAAAMQLRTQYGDPNALVTLTSPSGGLTLSPGAITAFLAGTATEPLPPGEYVYDIKVQESNGAVTRPYQGTATVTPEVTTVPFPSGAFGQYDFSLPQNSAYAALI